MTLFVVGEINKKNPDEWSFCGIFDSEKKAVSICKTEEHFVGPIELNHILPDKIIPCTDGYYPLLEKKIKNRSK